MFAEFAFKEERRSQLRARASVSWREGLIGALGRLLPVVGALVALSLSVWPGSASATAIPGQYIVVLRDSVADPGAVAREHAHDDGAQLSHVYRYALKGYAARIPDAALAKVRSDPRVLYVAPDSEVSAASTCPINTTSGFSSQCIPPGVDRIDGDLSSARSGDGTGSLNINVAVLDTGIDPTHPDLNVAGGTNCSQGKGFSDRSYHGTFVAGVIGAKDNGFGVVGVAPGARLWAVRVLDKNGKGSTSTVLCGIDWVTATRADSAPNNDIQVANMSLGETGNTLGDDGNCGRTKKDVAHIAICNSVAAGVTYVVSAGNESIDFQHFIPAAYHEVLTATAMADFDGKPGGLAGANCFNADDHAANFSNFATLAADQAHTIAAPGVCVVSTSPVGYALANFGVDTNYLIASGTSFASPHVAGTVALCIASGACAGLLPAQIIQKLRSDAQAYNTANPAYGFNGDPIGPVTGRYYGYLIRAAGY
jgi:subtilisin